MAVETRFSHGCVAAPISIVPAATVHLPHQGLRLGGGGLRSEHVQRQLPAVGGAIDEAAFDDGHRCELIGHPPSQAQDDESERAARRFEQLAHQRRPSVLQLAGDGEPVERRQHHGFDPDVASNHVVERAKRGGVVIGDARVDDPAAPQHVVDQEHAAETDPVDQLLPLVEVAGLVGIDEHQVDVFLVGQPAQRLRRGRDAQLDAITQPRLLPGLDADGRPGLADVAAQQGASFGQTTGDAQAGVARETCQPPRHYAHRRPGPSSSAAPLVIADRHPGHITKRPGLGLQPANHAVLCPAATFGGGVTDLVSHGEVAHLLRLNAPDPHLPWPKRPLGECFFREPSPLPCPWLHKPT